MNLLRRSAALAFALAATAGSLSAQQGTPSAGKSVKVGSGVYEVAVHDASNRVFAATTGSGDEGGQVYVLDGATLDRIRTIPTPNHTPYGIAVAQTSGTVYATDTRAGAVLVIDIASMQMVEVIENPADESGHLREIVVDDVNGRVYVSSYGENGLIWVIDDASRTLVDTFTQVGNGTSGMALGADGTRLWAANMAGGDITELDASTGAELRRFPAGGERPSNLTYDAERDRLWVANQTTNDATVIDVAAGEVLKSVAVGDQALGIRFNPVNDMVYVTARRSGIVTAVDAESMNVVTWMQTGSYPNTVAVNGMTGDAYVSNKARSAGRDAPPVNDPNGDTVTAIRR